MGDIEFKIKKNGDLEIEVNGVQGASCEDITKQLINRVGEVEEQNYTEEYVQELPDLIEQYEE